MMLIGQGWIPPTTDGALALVTRQPYGPVLSIPAFNYPLTLALRSIGGSSVIPTSEAVLI
jgi:acyl-CoA reductase-like NAD-dependent aldehyde dehydrogenase